MTSFQGKADNFLAPIVSVAWLQANNNQANNENVVVVDARAYLDDRDGYTNYLAGHLPGAVFVDLDTIVAGPPQPILGRHPLPDPQVFADGLGAVGIGHDTAVIAYDDLGGMIASRLVWMLRTLGQPAALLDGGIAAWTALNGEESLETGQPELVPVGNEPRSIDPSRLADADAVAAHARSGSRIVDSRAAPRYRGDVEPVDNAAGHVPGAINLPFTDNLDEQGFYRSIEVLAGRFGSAEVDDDTIFYCGSGVSACQNLLAVEAAGLGTPKLYVGSWSGWSSDPSRPVATGPQSGGD